MVESLYINQENLDTESTKDSLSESFDDKKYNEEALKIAEEKKNSKEDEYRKAEQLKQKLESNNEKENNNEQENKIPKWRKIICTGKTDKNDNISVVYNKNQWKKVVINNEEYKVKETFFMKDWGSMSLETKIWYLTIKRSMFSKKIEWLSFRKNVKWSKWEIQKEEIYKIKLSNQYEEQYNEFYKSWTNYKDTDGWKDKKPFWKRIKDFFNNIFVNKTNWLEK